MNSNNPSPFFICKNTQQTINSKNSSSLQFQLSPNNKKKDILLNFSFCINGENFLNGWFAIISDSKNNQIWTSDNPPSITYLFKDDNSFKLTVSCPETAKINDKFVFSINSPSESDTLFLTFNVTPSLIIIKTKFGQEKSSSLELYEQLKDIPDCTHSIFNPPSLKGYLFIECSDQPLFLKKISYIKKIYPKILGTINISEIDHFFSPPSLISLVSQGNIVELILGPFKGERAKIKSINTTKEEIVIELLEAMINIPITVSVNNVKIIE